MNRMVLAISSLEPPGICRVLRGGNDCRSDDDRITIESGSREDPKLADHPAPPDFDRHSSAEHRSALLTDRPFGRNGPPPSSY